MSSITIFSIQNIIHFERYKIPLIFSLLSFFSLHRFSKNSLKLCETYWNFVKLWKTLFETFNETSSHFQKAEISHPYLQPTHQPPSKPFMDWPETALYRLISSLPQRFASYKMELPESCTLIDPQHQCHWTLWEWVRVCLDILNSHNVQCW